MMWRPACSKLRFLSPSSSTVNVHRNITVKYFIGWAAELPNVQLVENVILSFHNFGTGHWALDIIGGTVLSRLVISGIFMTASRKNFATYAVRCSDNLRQRRKILEESGKQYRLGHAALGGAPPLLARRERRMKLRELKAERRKIIEKYNIHPARGFVYIGIEAVFWFSYSVAIRNITAGFPPDVATLAAMDMTQQGMLWFPNLTVSDPFYILPFISCCSFLFSSSYMKEWRRQNGIPDVGFIALLSFLSKPLALLIFALGTQLPTSLTLFTASAFVTGTLQSVAFTHPKVQAMLGIPQSSREPNRPVNFTHWMQHLGLKKFNPRKM